MNKVYLLTSGDGSDGDEWCVISIHATRESAEEKREKDGWYTNIHGETYKQDWDVEEWDVLGGVAT